VTYVDHRPSRDDEGLGPSDLSGPQPVLLEPELTLRASGPQPGQAVLVDHGVIADVGPLERVARNHPHARRVRLPGHLLMPGFVDTHHHLTQAFGKSLVFGEPSEIFRRVWVPLESVLDEQSAYLAAKLAALESLRGGFTTVVEAGTRAEVDSDTIVSATTEAGIRCVLGLVCNSQDGDPRAASRRAESHLSRWTGQPLVSPSLAVSIPEAASMPVLRRLNELCTASGAVFQTHVNEHLASVERSLESTGRRPLEYLADLGVLGRQMLAAHATLLTPAELQLLAKTGTAVSYNPVASGWKGNAVAPACAMDSMGVRFGIGTDGTRGDAFRLLDAAEFAQRIAHGLTIGDSSCGAGWTWLEHATAGAADAAGLGDLTGRIEPGMAADYLLVDLRVPELTPSHDLTWELVRLANRDQITAVVVAGEPRLWQGHPTDWADSALLTQAAKAAEQTLAAASIHRVHPTSQEARHSRRRVGAEER
jgi:cytosine/adenosine deaminase-related metal-dependent hydrolase